MQGHTKKYLFPKKTVTVLTIFISLIIFMSFGLKNSAEKAPEKMDPLNRDSVESVRAFMQVYKVLMSPRCMNCHPSGDVPLQGEDSHLHGMLPRRGRDGKGVYAMKCSNCHQPTNLDGPNKPPGHPEWHLPPANMKMVFQGRTPAQLAKQLANPKTNGNKNLTQLKEHADDGLVKVGWNMGEGRPAPPMSHADFKKAWITWIEKGAFAPKE